LGPNGDDIWAWLQERKSRGQVERIGISVYDGTQIDRALDRYNLDMVQLPLNVLDQRCIVGGQIARLKDRGVEIHARSIFLQGLLLMEPERVPSYFTPLLPHLIKWRRLIDAMDMTPTQGAFAFLRSIEAVDVLLVGVESITQFAQNIGDFAGTQPRDIDFGSLAINDERFLNPGKWSLVG
jgi:aryl-alcohol dehydrogenase-like predicted oxidoreductase